MRKKLCIIGAGASCNIILHFLKENPFIEITIFEKSKFGIGIGYQFESDSFLLNTPPEFMGIINNNDYIKYAKDKGINQKLRSSYGKYLEYCFNKIMQKFSNIKLINKEVRLVSYKDSKIYVDGEEFDYLVLASGGSFKKFKAQFKGLLVEDISKLEQKKDELLKCGNIGVLGSSQSATDILVYLYDNGYNGKISFISNNGLLPKVKEFFPSNGIELNGSTLQEIEQELLIRFPALNNLSKKESFFADIRFIKQKKHSLNKMMEELTPNLNSIWENFTDGCRKEFYKKYKEFFDRHRGGIVLANAEKMAIILKSDNLNVKKLSEACLEEYDALVCATGINPDYIKSYLSKGIYQDDNYGGIKTCIKSCNIYNSTNEIVPNIWAIGYMTVGSLKFVNSIYFLKYFGEKIANNINNINIINNLEL